MPIKPTKIIKATIWEDGDVVEMARFLVDGANGLQADVATLTRFIFNLSDGSPDTVLAEDVLVVADTIYDALQTTALDPSWTKDSTGYNFKNRIAGSNFSTGADKYRVEYRFVGASDEVFFIVYEHDAQKIRGS